MGVDHGRCDVGVAEQLLDGSDVVAGFEQMRSERVAECVTRCPFGEARRLHGYTEAALNHAFVQMVPSLLAGDGVAIASRCRKDPLPGPFSSSVWILC